MGLRCRRHRHCDCSCTTPARKDRRRSREPDDDRHRTRCWLSVRNCRYGTAMSTRARVAAVVVVGFLAAIGLATAFGEGAHDTAVVVALAGLGSVGAAIAG